MDHPASRIDSPATAGYLIVYPERRMVSGEQLIVWAQDDIENGDSDLFENADDVRTVEDAIKVLHDAGTVTVTRPRA